MRGIDAFLREVSTRCLSSLVPDYGDASRTKENIN